jgi:threonine/homoserine/homoserine lactone efflux protein
MDITAVLIFGGALMINAGMPGPSIAALVARVLASGPRDVIPFLAAMWIGEGLWLGAAAFGLSVLAQTFHAGFIVLKYCGVAYLLYLALKMWRAAGRHQERPKTPRGSPMQMFFTGLAITIGNPKLMVFYLALLPSIINLKTLTLAGFGVLLLMMMIVLAGVFCWRMGQAGLSGTEAVSRSSTAWARRRWEEQPLRSPRAEKT